MKRWFIQIIIAWAVLIGLFFLFLPEPNTGYYYIYIICSLFGGMVSLMGTISQYLLLTGKSDLSDFQKMGKK